MLIKNAHFVLTPKGIEEKKNIVIKDSVIDSVSDSLAGVDKTDDIIDASGFLVIPGLVNAHTHAAMTLFRGYGDDVSLQDWLEKKIFPVEDKLKPKDIYWGSMLGIVEMIKSGTTCFNDMYYFMSEVARAADKSGIRAVLSRGLTDRDGKGEQKLKEVVSEIKSCSDNPRIQWMFGPHAIYTCSEDFLLKIKDLADKHGKKVHMHVSETKKEVDDCLHEKKKRPVEYLEDIGFLSESVIAAHCCWLSDKEIEILLKNKVSVVHNPASNMKLASGICPVTSLLKNNVNVCIGTDGAASNNNLDMFEEMKTTALLQKISTKDTTALKAEDVFRLATVNAAKALGINSGSIKQGKTADLVLLNLKNPALYPLHGQERIISDLVYATPSSAVDTVIIDGKLIMQNRKILTIDEEEIYEKVEDCVSRLFG